MIYDYREGGICPPSLGQCRRQPGVLKNHPPDGFLPACAGRTLQIPRNFTINKKTILSSMVSLFMAEKEGFARMLRIRRAQPLVSHRFAKNMPPAYFLNAKRPHGFKSQSS